MRPSGRMVVDGRNILGHQNIVPAAADSLVPGEKGFSSNDMSMASAGSYTEFQVSSGSFVNIQWK